MRWLIHAAAPCPVGIKQAMLDWWGPCVYEYYAATEGGGTIATPQDWLARPGHGGQAVAGQRDHDRRRGRERVPARGARHRVHADDAARFRVQGRPRQDRGEPAAGYFTVGDIGYLDDGGFLFLCDRKCDMIISGGANIYPAEVEAAIIMHPMVADVAVFGIPDDEWGESVKAVVEPVDGGHRRAGPGGGHPRLAGRAGCPG